MKNACTTGGAVLLAIAMVTLPGCTTSGIMQGRSSGKPVRLHYHHSIWNENGTISAIMPDGEHFSGKFVVGTTNSSGFGVTTGGQAGVFNTSGNTSQASAVLMGNRGDSMHCVFQLAVPSDGLEGGGVGQCKLSTGKVANVTF